MTKSKTSAFFILLAFIILLAHTVVPHHHLHDNSVIIISSLCDKISTGHHHPDIFRNETHDHDSQKNENDHCQLQQPILVPSNTFKQAISSNPHPYPGEFQATPPQLKSDDIAIAITHHFPAISFQSFYTNYVSGTSGLRAPPIF